VEDPIWVSIYIYIYICRYPRVPHSASQGDKARWNDLGAITGIATPTLAGEWIRIVSKGSIVFITQTTFVNDLIFHFYLF